MDVRQIADHLYMEKTDLEEAKGRVAGYGYVIAHMISQLEFGTPDEVRINWEELIELHAFGPQGELHVFGGPGELEAVTVREEENCQEFLEKSYLMRDHRVLKVREYLAADEDGQAVVVYTRPFAVS